ncbi:cytochrome P450 [Apiospora saccharicola]|uniref:Cytochrome P450 n=1 Tax=Apiospora saccharicola TaxID=335842 RepID=A0ABR1VN61_9PEZI
MALSIFNQFHKQEGPAATEAAAEALAKQITDSPEPQDALAHVHWDLLKFSYESPQSIDYALRVYQHTCGLLTDQFKNDYGTGAEAARRSLAMLLEQQVKPLNPYVNPEDVGGGVVERDWDYDGAEYANTTFKRAEILGESNQLGKAIRNVVELREERTRTVTAWAVEGRAHALGVAKAGVGDRADLPMHFDGLLKPAGMGHGYMNPWSKADFVAGCVGIRAAAKTFLDECSPEKRNELLESWKAELAEFLLEGNQATDDEHRKFRDGDFYVKYHAAWRRQAAIRGRACEPAVSYPTKEPFFGSDFQRSMYGDVSFLYRLHRRYGSAFQVRSWISLPVVCSIATENLRVINTSKDFGVEPMRLPGLEEFCGRGFITTDGDTWYHSRKLLKPSFDLSNIGDLRFLEKEVDRLLETLPDDNSIVDLQPLLYVTFLNSALHFVLGVDPSEQSSSAPLTPDTFVKSFHDALFTACFIDYYVGQTSEGDGEPRSKSLIRALTLQTDDPEFVRSQVIQAMMAAQDTTSELLTNALFLLARHPKYWEQLRLEFVGKQESNVTVETLLGCKLIENILHETLRIHPILPLLGRVSLRDTQLPVGGGPHQDSPVFIPKGTTVVMGYYALHRNPEVFGSDAEAFRPERWDSINPKQWEFLGFGSGNRACLGRQKAVIEASYVLARLAQKIEVLTSADSLEWKGEMKLTCKSANGCKVKVGRR